MNAPHNVFTDIRNSPVSVFWQNLFPLSNKCMGGRQAFYKWQGSCLCLMTRFKSIYNLIFQMGMRKNAL